MKDEESQPAGAVHHGLRRAARRCWVLAGEDGGQGGGADGQHVRDDVVDGGVGHSLDTGIHY